MPTLIAVMRSILGDCCWPSKRTWNRLTGWMAGWLRYRILARTLPRLDLEYTRWSPQPLWALLHDMEHFHARAWYVTKRSRPKILFAESTDEYFAHKFGGPAHVLARDVRKLKSETIRSTTKVHLIWWYTVSFIITWGKTWLLPATGSPPLRASHLECK